MKFLQDFIDVYHTSSVKRTDEKPCLIVEVVCVFALAWSIQWFGNISKWRSLPSIRNWQSYAACCRSGEVGFHSVKLIFVTFHCSIGKFYWW